MERSKLRQQRLIERNREYGMSMKATIFWLVVLVAGMSIVVVGLANLPLQQ